MSGCAGRIGIEMGEHKTRTTPFGKKQVLVDVDGFAEWRNAIMVQPNPNECPYLEPETKDGEKYIKFHGGGGVIAKVLR